MKNNNITFENTNNTNTTKEETKMTNNTRKTNGKSREPSLRCSQQ